MEDIITNNRFTAKAMTKFFPANSIGDDVELYSQDRKEVIGRFNFIRQQRKRSDDSPMMSLADFIAPKESGVNDYLGAFVVTAGKEVEEYAAFYENKHDDYTGIMIKAIGDRFAEALAELMHKEVRTRWGFADLESTTIDDLIKEKYRGIRPAPGYPACPDHTEKQHLFELLDVEQSVGISLTESYAMYPAAAVSGFYFAHPQAKYFSVGKLKQDQIEDYAKRKNMEVVEVERWLSPNLGYDPD